MECRQAFHDFFVVYSGLIPIVEQNDGRDVITESTCIMIKDKNSESSLLKGNLFILVATIFFGVNIPVVKFLIPHWMTAMDVSAFRLFGGCILFWLVSVFMKCEPIERKDWGRLVLGGAVGLFSFIYLFNLSLSYADPIDVSIIMTLPPVFVILIGVIFRHRRVSWLELSGIVVAFAGAVIVIVSGKTKDGDGSHVVGDVLALASALCYALYLVITEGPSKTYRPVTMLRWIFLFSAVPALFLLPSLPPAHIFHAADFEPWVLIGFVVLCPTFFAYFLVSPAIKLIGSELVSIYQYLVPVIATVASVAMGICGIDWLQIVAMVIVIGGMGLTTYATRSRKSEPDVSKTQNV